MADTQTIKSLEQVKFEQRVLEAEIKVASYPPQQLELLDRIACDLFCSGNPDGYSQADNRHWNDLNDSPVFTRGATTIPAKLQWRLKAIRIMDILDQWMRENAGKPANKVN